MPDPKNPPPPADAAGASADRAAAAPIVFQCPNGHRISVPAKLAGKRGACSKCGTAVVIPPASTLPPKPPAAARPEVAPSDTVVGGEEPAAADEGTITLKSPVAWRPPAEVAAEAPVAGAAEPRAGAEPSGEEPPAPPPSGGPVNATALLVARLWAERDHGGIVELHLVGGSVILPEWYEPRWSLGSHGLFASQAADGSVTLTAVAWDSVQKVIVRQVEGLPDGMFE